MTWLYLDASTDSPSSAASEGLTSASPDGSEPWHTVKSTVLLSRMADGQLDTAPIWDDVRTLRGSQFSPGAIDVIFGGFPCQNTSRAGNRRGLAGEKSGLFWEVIRLTDELKPRWVLLENSEGVLDWLEEIVQAFRDIGYRMDPDDYGLISCEELGAPFERDRWFALAYPESKRFQGVAGVGSQAPQPRSPHCSWWETEPDLVRVVSEFPFRVECIKALGGVAIPIQAETAAGILWRIE